MLKILDKFLEKIELFPTGSRVYGPYTADSDLDIVATKYTANILKYIMTKLGFHCETNDYDTSESFYFKMGFFRVNIIAAINKRDFNLWRYRTEAMKRIAPIQNRAVRIDIFRSLFPRSIEAGYISAEKQSFIKTLFGYLSPQAVPDTDDPMLNNPNNPARNPTNFNLSTPIGATVFTEDNATPRVDGFTYKDWKEANPGLTDEKMLLMPQFAPFWVLIHSKKEIKKD